MLQAQFDWPFGLPGLGWSGIGLGWSGTGLGAWARQLCFLQILLSKLIFPHMSTNYKFHLRKIGKRIIKIQQQKHNLPPIWDFYSKNLLFPLSLCKVAGVKIGRLQIKLWLTWYKWMIPKLRFTGYNVWQ